ncbi:hypothetical protein F0U44_11150 [Nocardioides humilatus]|uniref:GH26 domain-containing protein n=1 Tax=Nocardioides humilatus TaxID=2607660 RepID=A0A5B1LEE6_9ACTN|nr:hypothetical protein [Nocardioides humilatus]KAA1419012.1 hypothetical protein F0U44_11150 [Nocardioides humilatus]
MSLTNLRRVPALLALTCALGLTAAVPGAAHSDDATGDSTSTAVESARAAGPGFLAPRKGAWFGVSIDWANDSLADYSRRLGHKPAVAVTFASFPMSDQEKIWLDQAADQAKAGKSRLLLTLEPWGGLDEVTAARSRELARLLARYNRQGLDIYVRFAHEMNGSWYAWAQQPEAYVAAFRRVANAVHDLTSRTAMMWAPNYGGGYPFAGGTYQAPPGSHDADVLDTNGDGSVTGADDPYRPYWPGKKYVDWVGMSVYHWGAVYPWGENEVPEPGKFRDLLRGTYDGAAGNELAVPDFYAEYGAALQLPVAVTETAALYVPDGGGAGEMAIKSAWWDQVLDPANSRRLPWLKMVNWFEWKKNEPEVGGVVDWTATTRRPIRTGFVDALPGWLRYAPR